MNCGIWILATMLLTAPTWAAVPKKSTPLGKPDAPVGGTFNRNLGSGEPESFNPINTGEYDAEQVFDYVSEGLLDLNPETYQFEPRLAESYAVSKDYLTYTFHLRKDAKWSDGKPVTASDVKFSMDCVKDPRFKAAGRLPSFENVEAVEIVDPAIVKIKLKKKYFKNLEVLGTVSTNPIVPEHIYKDPDKKWTGAPLFGSGPYKVEEYTRGKNIILVRNPDWWGKDIPNLKGLGKFEKITFRFVKDQNLALEMIKKGQIDHMWPILSEHFEKKAVGEPFGTTVIKVQAENKIPKPWGFIGWNERNPIFADKNVRKALSHLLNRKLLIEKYMYGKSVEAVGPVYYQSPFLPPEAKPIPFDPKKANELLKKAGWVDSNKDGILEKTIDGKPTDFKFTLLYTTPDVEKWFTLYQQDLKNSGIAMELKLLEWSTFAKLLEDRKFDAISLGWAGDAPELDLKEAWHSESARAGGSNYISYANKDVDKYIDQAREEMDAKKRKVLWQKALKQIIDDAPYTFLFNRKYELFLVNSRIGFEKPTYTYGYSYPYWYMAK